MCFSNACAQCLLSVLVHLAACCLQGARTPARLPVAVETFLQGEALKYTKPDPGLLQIVV